jgi:hypothetical protein
VEHTATLQVPLLQVAPEAQALPQTPQLLGSVCVFTQALLHTFVPVGVLVGPQVPVASPVFAELQASQASLQVPEQHTPSVEQELVPHSWSLAQAVPVAFFAVHSVPAQ